MNWQAVVGVITAVSALGVLIHNILKERQPLALVERLSAIAGPLPAGKARQLVEDYRDELSVRWILKQRTPKDRTLVVLVNSLRIASGLSFVIWAVEAVAKIPGWSWALYFAALVFWTGGRNDQKRSAYPP